eukprot:TRINITY_DN30160_c0_g1_i1.p1 TRINITY_DN30160_c0_g1~~TRINITY_DN30160_c0_g1_i1.p1  ORF type:complete len:129 (+),score=23.99 TRINITY_DN30160_c0_g1_i1:43-429(+)
MCTFVSCVAVGLSNIFSVGVVGFCCVCRFFFFFSSRRRHTRCREVSWARRCVQETGIVIGFFIIGLGGQKPYGRWRRDTFFQQPFYLFFCTFQLFEFLRKSFFLKFKKTTSSPQEHGENQLGPFQIFS